MNLQGLAYATTCEGFCQLINFHWQQMYQVNKDDNNHKSEALKSDGRTVEH